MVYADGWCVPEVPKIAVRSTPTETDTVDFARILQISFVCLRVSSTSDGIFNRDGFFNQPDHVELEFFEYLSESCWDSHQLR